MNDDVREALATLRRISAEHQPFWGNGFHRCKCGAFEDEPIWDAHHFRKMVEAHREEEIVKHLFRSHGTVTPPADDVREEPDVPNGHAAVEQLPRFLARRLSEVDPLATAIEGAIPDDVPGWRFRYSERVAESIREVFEVRPRGTVTDAEVEAAWSVIERDGLTILGRGDVRAAIEAAREAE